MSLLVLSCNSERRQVLSPGHVAVDQCDHSPSCCQPRAGGPGPRAAQGSSWWAETRRSLGFPVARTCLFPSAVRGDRDVLEGEAGAAEMLSLPRGSSIPVSARLCPQPCWAFPRFKSICMALNGSKVASCFLAITIPFFLSYAFHLKISEAFNC